MGYGADGVLHYWANRRTGQPFCLFLSWGTPHCPYHEVPRKYLEMYPREEIELLPNAGERASRRGGRTCC